MTNPNTIARSEIAELLGVSLTKLLNIINHSDVEISRPLRREGPRFVYDREAIRAWIATEPLKNLTWKQSVKKQATPEHITQLNRAFLSGSIGVSSEQRNRAQFKKIVCKHVRGKPRNEEVSMAGRV